MEPEPRRKKNRRIRERHMARKRRSETFSELRDSALPRVSLPGGLGSLWERIGPYVRDGLWYLLNRTPALQIMAGLALVIFLFYVATHLLGGRVFPNVWALGVDIGGMTAEEAEAALQNAWQNEVLIELAVGGESLRSVRPDELGLLLDAGATVQSARGVGLAGMPLGYAVEPVVTVDYGRAQLYLLDLTEAVYIPPFEAGYTWEANQLVGVSGRQGRALDVALSVESLLQNPQTVLARGRLELLTLPLPPNVSNPEPHLNAARAFASQQLQIIGYDPFKHEYVPWTTTREEVTRWLAAGSNGLTLREDVFKTFVDGLTTTLNPDPNAQQRYLDLPETVAFMQQAVASGESTVYLRIRYRPSTYTVVAGDNGFRIGRKTGVPFQLIDNLNAGRNWNQLSINDTITIPSRDALLQYPPVPNKRIIVDLQAQWLLAYEDGEVVFSWAISSGLEEAPTYPGIFQILSHNEVALGSGYSLCSTAGCSQWRMSWFMGIYEVIPGLMNGFHGAVLLPNGAYLGGGNVGIPATFGCVMSLDSNARLLYEWAEIGTVVEIISEDFAPISELAKDARQRIIERRV